MVLAVKPAVEPCTIHSAPSVNGSKDLSGTRCMMVFTSLLAMVQVIASSSLFGVEKPKLVKIPVLLNHRVCGLFRVPP
ncbi:hypothetical protein D3C76_584150 [compost metagenome]